VKVYLIRHGEAAAAWDKSADPGLSELGRQQAQATANALVNLNGVRVLSSPMARARETANIYGELLERCQDIEIEAAFTEIPTPANYRADRGRWLKELLQQGWSEQREAGIQTWCQQALQAMFDLEARFAGQDVLIFTHFMVINLLVAEALGVDQVLATQPDTASVTELELLGGKLSLVAQGAQKETVVG